MERWLRVMTRIVARLPQKSGSSWPCVQEKTTAMGYVTIHHDEFRALRLGLVSGRLGMLAHDHGITLLCPLPQLLQIVRDVIIRVSSVSKCVIVQFCHKLKLHSSRDPASAEPITECWLFRYFETTMILHTEKHVSQANIERTLP